MLNQIVAACALRGGPAYSAGCKLRGPLYRRGDEPARVVSPVRLEFVLSYCRAADGRANEFGYFRAARILDNAKMAGVA